jgi:hypothetical protein
VIYREILVTPSGLTVDDWELHELLAAIWAVQMSCFFSGFFMRGG